MQQVAHVNQVGAGCKIVQARVITTNPISANYEMSKTKNCKKHQEEEEEKEEEKEEAKDRIRICKISVSSRKHTAWECCHQAEQAKLNLYSLNWRRNYLEFDGTCPNWNCVQSTLLGASPCQCLK